MEDSFVELLRSILIKANYDTHFSMIKKAIEKYESDKTDENMKDIILRISLVMEKNVLENSFGGDRQKMKEDFDLFKEMEKAVPQVKDVLDNTKPFE